jgi:hypothetical protein
MWPNDNKKQKPKLTDELCISCDAKLLDFELAYGEHCTRCRRVQSIQARRLIEPHLRARNKPKSDIDDIIN